MTPTRSQQPPRHASTRSLDATRRKTHPSRHHDRHTASAITPPWGRLPLRLRGRRPRAARRTVPRTSAVPQGMVRAWKHHRRPALRHRAPPHPRPHRGPNPTASGNVWHGGPTGHDARRDRRPSGTTPHRTGRRRSRQSRHLPVAQPRPGPRPGPGTHRRPGGRPTAHGPG